MKRSALIVLATLTVVLGYSLPSEAHFRGGVWIGPGWGPGWWGPPYGYSYPYYQPAPPVVIQQQPQEYVYQPQPAQPAAQQYWYYCSEAKAYYPYVKKCPTGWLKVVPTPAPTPAPAPQNEQEEEE